MKIIVGGSYREFIRTMRLDYKLPENKGIHIRDIESVMRYLRGRKYDPNVDEIVYVEPVQPSLKAEVVAWKVC